MIAAELTVGVPAAIAAAVERYAAHRAPPTMFVRALLANDLEDACAYSPKDLTIAELRATVRLIFNAVPGRARGSANAVDAWLAGKDAPK